MSEKVVSRDIEDIENVEWPVILRPSLVALTFQLIPYLLVILALYYILGVLDSKFPESIFDPIFAVYRSIFHIARVLLLLELIRRYYNDLYVFGASRVAHRMGRISTNYRIASVKYRDIREIEVSQSILGRMLRFGDIQISTASTDTAEIELKNVALPRKITQWIYNIRAQRSKEHSANYSRYGND